MDEAQARVDELQSWVAKAAITELITRYAALNDAGDWEAVASLYTEDGRMNRPTAPNGFVSGREAILAAFKARPKRASRHLVANVLVTLHDDGRASATSQLLLYVGTAADGGGSPVLPAKPPLVGTSRDELLQTPQGWRFRERRGSLDFRMEP